MLICAIHENIGFDGLGRVCVFQFVSRCTWLFESMEANDFKIFQNLACPFQVKTVCILVISPAADIIFWFYCHCIVNTNHPHEIRIVGKQVQLVLVVAAGPW